MSYQIHLRPDPGYEQYGNLAANAAETVLNHQDAPECLLSIVLTSSEYIAHLNATYRDTPGPTDVLSFSDGEKDPETGKIYLGDIIIAVPEAEMHAERYGHSVEAELNLLVVHGVLHLLGYSHVKEKERVEMWSVQSTALRILNNEIIEPSYEHGGKQ